MFRTITKTFAVLLPVLWLASTLAVAQTGGSAPGGGAGAAGSPGGSGSIGPRSGGNPGTPGTLPSTPGQASPGDTLGRPGDPGSPPGVPNTANPATRVPEPPGTSPLPESGGEREQRQQGEAPRTAPSTDPQRRSGIETPSSPGMSVPDAAETPRPRPR